jgi:hypothetical protein
MREYENLNLTEAELDARLNSAEQLWIAKSVASLPEEQVSMAWRSQLNEKLRASAPVKKARRVWQVLVPATAFASCLVLGVTIFLSRETVQSPTAVESGAVEAAIVASYREHSSSRDVGGVGLHLEELDNTTDESVEPLFSEADLGAL